MTSRPEIRTAAATVLAAAIAATEGEDPDLSHVTVHRQDAGDEKGSSSVTFGQIEGERTTRAFRGGGPIPMTDIFILPAVVEVRETPSPESDLKVQQILDLIDAVFFAPPSLAIANVSLHPGRLVGPNPYRSETGGAQIIAAARSEIEVHHQT